MKFVTHLGAYAILTHGAAVALVRKTRGPYTGMWDLPGGRIEFGETPIEALAREIKEETGVAGVSPRLLDARSVNVTFTNESNEEVRMHHIAILYHALVADTNWIEPQQSEDTAEVQWFGENQLAELCLSPFADYMLKNSAIEWRQRDGCSAFL